MLQSIKACFSTEEINTRRQEEMDLAKGFAILFMVWTHALETCGDWKSKWFTFIVDDMLGSPFAAPVFMICMGIGMVYTRRNTPKDMAARGLKLLGVGLLLNCIRYELPTLLSLAIWKEPFALSYLLDLVWVDILQFAGLAFLVLAAAKKLRLSDRQLLLLGLVCSVAGVCLRGISSGNLYADAFLGYLWGADDNTCFPMLNWLIFPIFGILYGKRLRRCQNKKTFYRRVSPLCFVLAMAYLLIMWYTGRGLYSYEVEYYLLGTVDAFFICLLAVGLFGIDYWLAHTVKQNILQPLNRLSRNINSVYCIHWSLLGFFSTFFVSGDGYNSLQVTVTALVVLIVSDALAAFYVNHIKHRSRRQVRAQA